MRKLYYYQLCAFSRTALLALAEKKLDFSVEITKFWDRDSPLLELNSFGRLPVLIDLNGSVVSGIFAIVEYLEEVYDNVKLLEQSATHRAEARRIFQWFNEDFASEVTVPLVFEKDIKRYFQQSPSSSTLIKQIKVSMNAYLKQIEKFVERRNWLAGNTFSFADIAAAAHLSVVDYLGGVSWHQFQLVKEWYMRIKSRPSFRKLLTDRVPSLLPSSHYSDLDF
ncbi:MAG: glutathione S-transferase family protein [Holosporales bacterium]|jgi:glutathione S-transferase|nr:glutathione S-transferase family protein [Holosporales bacterium]